MNASVMSAVAAEKYKAARNALVARYTLGTLREEQKQKIDEQIVELLILSGIRVSRARKYRTQLRETQYYGMAALAMAFLGIRPALTGILQRERWEHVPNPLIALTDAEAEIAITSGEILRKHRVLVVISDEDKRAFRWERLLPEARN